MPQFIATFRAAYDAKDEVEAVMIADKIKENGSLDLAEDEGDEFGYTQVSHVDQPIDPEEVLTRLRVARNTLINSRVHSCFDLARELDKEIWKLEHHDQHEMSGYDYGRFIEIAHAVLKEGRWPLG